FLEWSRSPLPIQSSTPIRSRSHLADKMKNAEFELIIKGRTDENGQMVAVNVSGPIQAKFLCYEMLEGARDAIKDFNDKALSESEITPARGILTPFGKF